MQGTPDPVLGSDPLTFAISCAAGGLAAALPVVFRDRLPAHGVFAVVGGLAYASACLGAWAGARVVADAFESSVVGDPVRLVGLLVVGALVLGAQYALPLYLFARWRLRLPLAGLFGATALVLYAFLRVRGESDPLGLYALFFGPLVVVSLALVGSGELVVRRLR